MPTSDAHASDHHEPQNPRLFLPESTRAQLPEGWRADAPDERDVPELTALARRHETRARGWASSSEEDLLIEVSERGYLNRENLVLRDAAGELRGFASAHDRAAGRMLLTVTVDDRIGPELEDRAAEALFAWADEAARRIGAERGLEVQQIDSGAFADDDRQHRWLQTAGFEKVRTWWQMSRPVTPDEADLDSEIGHGVRIRQVERQGTGMPSEEDLRIVHDVLESAFEDHFNSHEETFDEFVFRLREDPGHRWDHWWIAEVVPDPDDPSSEPEPAGALVGVVADGEPAGSYVEYIGVLANARGRGVAKSLLRTVIADAATRGRDRVGLEVDASSPTGAEGLYVSMGWTTKYTTESWHKDVPVT
ncbi:GNAT family N-acetyltransferase [Nocardioides mesophilus]|uniref:GNAT family N-acetyltransferase n=1 Tax=Nocardioides mesophilus TaxID=433659 RepID=A0A7G9R6I7_9ACTN|nr:GNAT family N-acetyltransferase [Nocardioides mesophilus]QNN51212.1 GNAT family N-acetyltransferase [Nocardioides mesophilus]